MNFILNLPSLVVVFICSTLNWLLTALGSTLVYFIKNENKKLNEIALGSSSGIMIAATFFSLLLPAITLLENQPKFYLALLPLVFMLGAGFVSVLDHLLPHEHLITHEKEGLHPTHHTHANLLMFAMTLHNIPEGLAVGVAFANTLPEARIAALILSIGIGIQNLPEGLAISLPMKNAGMSKFKSMMYGQFSAIVEIPSAIIGYLAASIFNEILPFTLAFAAGAMLFVVVEELIPESKKNDASILGSFTCILGFVIMMALDILLS